MRVFNLEKNLVNLHKELEIVFLHMTKLSLLNIDLNMLNNDNFPILQHT